MKNVKNDNERDSTTMCPSERVLRRARQSEDQFLSAQSAHATAAMVGTLRDMRENLPKLADPCSFVKRHPWLLVSSAVVAGLAAGMALTPARPTPLQVQRPKSGVEPRPCGPEPAEPVHKASWLFATLGTLLAGALSTLIQTSIAATFALQGPPPEESPPQQSPASSGECDP